ncbi:hypothetical protein [Candidatus Clavichlamydia salmonicola]|uniref:hypothetical protein n=1 Tax=Candidatus Clavichlamydia salmonicola TaxID=469812 RepID=UPI001891AA83|nr:hypothetical protein [Candidatus Clavichlamydia salmonicola]
MNSDAINKRKNHFFLTSPILREPENYEEILKKLHLREAERFEVLRNKYNTSSITDILILLEEKNLSPYSISKSSLPCTELIKEPRSALIQKLRLRFLKELSSTKKDSKYL